MSLAKLPAASEDDAGVAGDQIGGEVEAITGQPYRINADETAPSAV